MIADTHVGDALVIGDALIDEIDTAGHGSTEMVGGAALNVAVGLRRLGIPARLLAMIGDDGAGDEIRQYLTDHTVPVIASPSQHGSSRAVSTRNDVGEPTYLFNDAALNRAIAFSPDTIAAIRSASAVVVSCYPFDNVDQSQQLLDAVSQARGMYVVDPNARPAMILDRDRFVTEFERHAARAWLVKISDEDSHYMYRESAEFTANRLLGLGARVVVATYGPGGAEAFLPGASVRVAIAQLPGSIVDTMGAGDATIATVVAEILQAGFHADPATWEAMLEHAMLNAAATCRRAGALLQPVG